MDLFPVVPVLVLVVPLFVVAVVPVVPLLVVDVPVVVPLLVVLVFVVLLFLLLLFFIVIIFVVVTFIRIIYFFSVHQSLSVSLLLHYLPLPETLSFPVHFLLFPVLFLMHSRFHLCNLLLLMLLQMQLLFQALLC